MSEMNDRELLELAAKAARYQVSGDGEGGFTVPTRRGACRYWMPIENDGDAMRLAVDLNMSIEIDSFNGDTIVMVNDAVGSPLVIINQRHFGNPCKATRRAIVRAAAGIGRQM